jgi:hypothetical protein
VIDDFVDIGSQERGKVRKMRFDELEVGSG